MKQTEPGKTSVHVRLEPEEIQAIDAWRHDREIVPSRTKACAHLMRLGWAALLQQEREQ